MHSGILFRCDKTHIKRWTIQSSTNMEKLFQTDLLTQAHWSTWSAGFRIVESYPQRDSDLELSMENPADYLEDRVSPQFLWSVV
jgi:hypothetical protein